MQLACPKCGTREIKVSSGRGLGDALKSLCGIYHLRCRRCKTRWETSMWEGGAWKYARCPRCYRQELTTWSLQYYNPPSSTMLMLNLGAKRYRCAACRCNFASFKPCKDKTIWRRREPSPLAVTRTESPANREMDLQVLAKAVDPPRPRQAQRADSDEVPADD